MPTTRTLIDRLSKTEPVEPRGWFRWLHYHFRGSSPHWEYGLEAVPDRQDWNQVAGCLSALSQEERLALQPIVARHAWSVGYLGLLAVADSFWESLSGYERGAMLAGASEDKGSGGWVRRHIGECSFSPESACEIACNAIWCRWPDILAAILNSGADLRSAIHRGDEGIYPKTRWAEFLDKVSHRAIDMIMEAALVRNDLNAVDLALQKGADPNMPIWKLERSYNENHSALSFAISEGRRDMAELLFQAGASPGGTDPATANLPLFLAIRAGWDELAEQFLLKGVGVRKMPQIRGNSELPTPVEPPVPPRRQHFGYWGKDLNWARSAVGSLIPFARIEEKQTFYIGDGQGGKWTTVLDLVIGSLDRLKKYESWGLDTRLTAEDLCSAMKWDAYEGLAYLLGKYGPEKRDRALFRIRRRKPGFGAVCREMDTAVQSDGINCATGFDPVGQPALLLPDGTKLYVDLDAIADPGHAHGPCLEGHFWLRVEDATYRRRQDRVVMTQIGFTWEMCKLPEYRPQLQGLLPCIKELDGRFIRLGQPIGKCAFRTRKADVKDAMFRWFDTPEFQSVLDEAERGIRAQREATPLCKKPVLSKEELAGYPARFWPHLTRMETGFIGIAAENSGDDPDVFSAYNNWARKNKMEDCFVPDSRLLSWDEWEDVPPEYRPFFIIDPLLHAPTVRFDSSNDYEKAMIHKAIAWSNNRTIPQILDAFEDHER